MSERSLSKICAEDGFSMVELIIALVLSLIILGGATAVYTGALSTREREGGRVDAITSAQAALSVMSREIGNAGYGLYQNNGLVLEDCGPKQLRYRTNVNNDNYSTNSPGEDVMYLFDSDSRSVVRFDRNVTGGGLTSGIINRVSDVDFVYHQYTTLGDYVGSSTTPTADTGRVTITLSVILPDVRNQPSGRVEQVSSDVTLRNSIYMLNQY